MSSQPNTTSSVAFVLSLIPVATLVAFGLTLWLGKGVATYGVTTWASAYSHPAMIPLAAAFLFFPACGAAAAVLGGGALVDAAKAAPPTTPWLAWVALALGLLEVGAAIHVTRTSLPLALALASGSLALSSRLPWGRALRVLVGAS